ncbi:MAG TPA: hypothetical protein VLS48_06595 [Anaerolineales bacterium]|nr:hypothetical protein [Anaerolineales bacterium]
MRRYGCLLLWLTAIIFPLGWLTRFPGGYRQMFDALFSPEWVHVTLHILLFAGLSILLIWVFQPRPSSRTVGMLLGAAVLVGWLQEIAQAISRDYFGLAGIVFDLGVDLSGAALGLAGGFWLLRKINGRPKRSSPDFKA